MEGCAAGLKFIHQTCQVGAGEHIAGAHAITDIGDRHGRFRHTLQRAAECGGQVRGTQRSAEGQSLQCGGQFRCIRADKLRRQDRHRRIGSDQLHLAVLRQTLQNSLHCLQCSLPVDAGLTGGGVHQNDVSVDGDGRCGQSQGDGHVLPVGGGQHNGIRRGRSIGRAVVRGPGCATQSGHTQPQGSQ